MVDLEHLDDLRGIVSDHNIYNYSMSWECTAILIEFDISVDIFSRQSQHVIVWEDVKVYTGMFIQWAVLEVRLSSEYEREKNGILVHTGWYCNHQYEVISKAKILVPILEVSEQCSHKS